MVVSTLLMCQKTSQSSRIYWWLSVWIITFLEAYLHSSRVSSKKDSTAELLFWSTYIESTRWCYLISTVIWFLNSTGYTQTGYPTQAAQLLHNIMGCFGKPETDEEKAQKERSKRIEKTIREDKQKYKATHRLLLLGNTLLTNRWPNIWTSFILKIIILWQPNIKHIYLHTAYAFSSSSELSCDSLVIDVIKWLICCSSCQPSNSSHSLPLRSDELDDSDWAPYSQVMCVKSSLLGLSICTLKKSRPWSEFASRWQTISHVW